MSWTHILAWIFGVACGTGLMMWVQSARKYHEERTEAQIRKDVAEMTGELPRSE